MINDARKDIYQAILDYWTAQAVDADLVFANESFDPTPGRSWVRVTMLHTGGGQDSLGGTGNRKFLREGSITAQVFCPQDGGLATSDALVEPVLAALEGLTFTLSNIRTYGGTINEIGPDNGWYQTNVGVPFEYDVLK